MAKTSETTKEKATKTKAVKAVAKKTVEKEVEVKKTTVKKIANKKAVDSTEFAVIETGGKQYQVSVGDVLNVEKMIGEFSVGDKISFDKVLLVDNGSDTTIGTPYISGAKVDAELVEIGRAPKVTVIRYKSKSRYFKKKGHRQPYFKVKINSIK